MHTVPNAIIKESMHGGQPLEVKISLLREDLSDPAMLMCLPDAERWRMAMKQVRHPSTLMFVVVG